MSVSSDLEDIVMICEFYSDTDCGVYVDLENSHITMGEYGIDPVRVDGHLVGYLVEDPEGVTHEVNDLDSYFQSVLDWEDC